MTTAKHMKITIEYTDGSGSISATVSEDNRAGYDVMRNVLGEFWRYEWDRIKAEMEHDLGIVTQSH